MTVIDNKRELLTNIFDDTQRIINNDSTLQDDIKSSIINTKFYKSPVNLVNYNFKERDKLATIRVTDGRTIATAHKYVAHGYKTAVLNFASATSPGGRVTTGSNAQEESICRISTLYNTLITEDCNKFYYEYHKKNMTVKPFYSDSVIYTPNITVIKPDVSMPDDVLNIDSRWKVDVITCAAPNLIRKTIDHDRLRLLLIHRISIIFQAAMLNDVDVLILGAWGCGVFKNPPLIVADAFKTVIEIYRDKFDVIDFAIINDHRGSNYKIFEEILSQI